MSAGSSLPGARARVGLVAGSLTVATALELASLAAVRAAPPTSETRAPKVPDDRSLADAVTVEPGVTCLDRDTLLADLGSWRDDDRVDLRVGVRVHGSASDARVVGFEVTVGTEVVVERRFAPAPADCADLHAVVALAVAIALDDTLASELGIVAPAPAPALVDRPAQVEPGDGDLPREPTPAPARRRPGPPLAASLGAGVFAGLTPQLSAGGLASFDVRPRDHFDVRLGALATHLPRLDLDTGAVAVTVAAGRVDLCWGTAPISVRLRACAGFAGGATIAQGRGFASNFRRSTPWFAGVVGLDLRVHLVGPLALLVGLDGVFPVQRTRLDVRSDAGQLLASVALPVAGVVLAVGPQLEF